MIILVSFFMFCHVYRTPEIIQIPFNPSDSRFFFSLPPFHTIHDQEERKIRFFNFIRPIIESENRRIMNTRKTLVNLFSTMEYTGIVSDIELTWMDITARRYGLEPFNPHDPDMQNRLLKRVDTVPMTLAIAQAANESAWGTSRFARQGNNLFGLWSYTKGSGMVPERRDQDRTHEVAKFLSVNSSVRRYLHTLNTNTHYKSFRTLRHAFRQNGDTPNGHDLAEGLMNYSSKGKKYVQSIRSMIRNNEKYLTI